MTPTMFAALKSALAADVDTIDEPAVWKDGDSYRIISGHHRVKAATELGWAQVSVKVFDDAECDEYWYRKRLLSVNKTHGDPDDEAVRRFLENSIEIDPESLEVDLGDFLADTGYSPAEIDSLVDSLTSPEGPSQDGAKYTKKIVVPIYEPKNEAPPVQSLVDTQKSQSLMEKIKGAEGIPDEVRTFLNHAAARHTVFDYRRIADFYAHASAPVQRLMEASALVIIDFNQAIEGGFVRLTDKLAKAYDEGEYAK